jgi:glutaredoxin-dependent peroxiredoxin
MSIQVGKKAPEFTLFSSEKKEVKLSDFRGQNVLIHFFPQAFTGVCTKQLCEARDNMAVYQKLNAQVIGISVDSVFTLGKFKEENNYTFPLLSDFNKKVIKKYDAYLKDFVFGMQGVSKRGAIVVDKKGIIRYAEILANAGELPNFVAIKETLNSLS